MTQKLHTGKKKGRVSATHLFSLFCLIHLPSHWQGIKVIDGDDSDLRFQDPRGVIVGLLEKGLAKKDETGFVVEPC